MLDFQEKPHLTLYRDGLANLNGAAGRLLIFQDKAAAVQLLAPTGPSCPYWLLLAPPQGPGPRHALYGRADRVRCVRFRSPAFATAAFAVLPEGQEALSFQLEPEGVSRYRLLPPVKNG